MKKALLFLLIPIVILSLVSCKSTGSTLSEEQCQYAMRLALSKAQERTLSELFKTISSEQNGVPLQFSFIPENKDQIPGMDYLLQNWSAYFRDYSLNCLDDFSSLTNALVNNIYFSDALSLVSQDPQSGSNLFMTKYQTEVLTFFQDFMKNIDTSSWDKVTSHYNAWISTRALLGDYDAPSLPATDIRQALALMFSEMYFNTLSHQEELFRTTPDPYSDDIAAQVFGLR